MTADLKFWPKLAKLAKACNYIQKDGRNEFHKYSYATATSVYERVSDSLFECGLTSYTKAKVTDLREKQTAKGMDFIAIVQVTLFIVDIETGCHIEVEAPGSGQDSGDKAVMKANTAALKYAWMMALNMATGDDPEADSDTDYKNEGKEKPKPEPRGPYKPQGEPTGFDKAANAVHVLEGKYSHLSGHEGFSDAVVALVARPTCSCGSPMRLGHSEKGGFFLNCESFTNELADCKDEGERKALKLLVGPKHSFHWAKPKFAKV